MNNSQDQRLQVMIRIKPTYNSSEDNMLYKIADDNKKINIHEFSQQTNEIQAIHSFTFNHIFLEESQQEEVFEYTAKRAIDKLFQGYNSTILAYGQTGSGKTFTMEGGKRKHMSCEQKKGIIPRTINFIFEQIKDEKLDFHKVIVRVSYLQIYNEIVSDLLQPDRTNLNLRQAKDKGVFVEDLSEFVVNSESDVLYLLKKGSQFRATASTQVNDLSSRSHSAFILTVEQLFLTEQNGNKIRSCKTGKLFLVDLAGSERVKVSNAQGQRLEEVKSINKSLSCLGKVISQLADKNNSNKSHIPYRDSKLTRLLENSLGGNCVTIFLGMITPQIQNYHETLSTLKFAQSAKKIKNKVTINEELDQTSLLAKYEVELQRLKLKLAEKNKNIVDHSQIQYLQKQQQQAESDKMAALKQLEERTHAFAKEKEEKKILEEKIQYLEQYVMTNQANYEQLQNEIKNYETTQNQLKQKQQELADGKSQREQMKSLLLQQKDIINKLTVRLNERDDTINQLQQEIEAYDKVNTDTESLLRLKNRRIHQLEEIMNQNGIHVPNLDCQILENDKKRKYKQEFKQFETIIYDNQSSNKEHESQNEKITQNDYQNKLNLITEEYKIGKKKLEEKVQQQENNNIQLLSLLQQNFQKNYLDQQFHQQIKYVKNKIDNIIEELSMENKPDNLNQVAKDLLQVHSYLTKLDQKHEQKVKVFNQYVSEQEENQEINKIQRNADIKRKSQKIKTKQKSKQEDKTSFNSPKYYPSDLLANFNP